MNRRAVILGLAGVALTAAAAKAQLLNPFTAYWSNIARSAAKNDAATVQKLLIEGKSPNDTDDDGHSGLHIAAINGNLTIATLLVKGGAVIDLKDPLGDTPLFYAADRSQPEIVKLLLDAGAVPDAENRSGVTPLMTAARRGNTEIVRMLLAKGANPRRADYTGRDAIGWAEDSRKQSLIQLLRQQASRR